MSLPSKIFSFGPRNGSSLPLIAASVKTLVVSWKDAADKKDSLAKDAFVIPRIVLLTIAGTLPCSRISLLISLYLASSINSPGNKSVSPGFSTLTLRNI